MQGRGRRSGTCRHAVRSCTTHYSAKASSRTLTTSAINGVKRKAVRGVASCHCRACVTIPIVKLSPTCAGSRGAWRSDDDNGTVRPKPMVSTILRKLPEVGTAAMCYRSLEPPPSAIWIAVSVAAGLADPDFACSQVTSQCVHVRFVPVCPPLLEGRSWHRHANTALR
jgi:hypothetical protein